MPRLTPESLPEIQQAIGEAGLDGWLLYDFRASNPIAREFLGMADAHLSRRIFVLIPRSGVPLAITHNIEQGAWRDWPVAWRRERYSSWRELEGYLQAMVGGKRLAMEYSPGDAVPYLDRIPAGMLELIREAGATVSTSGELVSRFYATWTPDNLAAHIRSAEHLHRIVHEAFAHAGAMARAGTPIAEHALQARIMAAFDRAGMVTYSPPNVSLGAHAADPHYEPSADATTLIVADNLLLIDLWAREPGHPYADQTWMGSIGAPSERGLAMWNVVRDSRDAAIAFVSDKVAAGEVVRGADVDDAARSVIDRAGFGQYFTHRTGHSMDAREIHGSGPNLDNLETRDERLLIPGVGFSIEPGIYIPGEIGLRTEVNAYVDESSVLITPGEIQRDLIIA
ncbi:MAG: aminopeptidase P family protein [Gemmatimonadetes bacterium]|nr:aminopeptidase P family protein [Gemmatimonadota bacterium]